MPAGTGIIGFTAQISDDRKFALVEMVARDRAAFKDILADRNPNVKVFEKGKATRAEVLAEFQKYKRDIDLTKAGVSLP